jgi:vacuolar-type H+-ATPase subunit H
MVETTLQKIKAIEEKAEEIIKHAHQSSAINLNKSRKKYAEELKTQEEQSKKEGEALILAAEKEAQKEASQIEAASQKEIKELKKKAQPKIESAKKEILRCLS